MATTTARTPINGAAHAGTSMKQRNRNAATAVAPRGATIGDLARLLDAELIGDAATPVLGVAGLDNPHPGSILFIENEKLYDAALASSAAAIIAPPAAAQNARAANGHGKATILIGNPRLAFARVMEYFEPMARHEPGVHATAVVEKGAVVSAGATIGAHCYIGQDAHIERGAVLYPHVYIGEGAQIGEDSTLFPSVVINHHVQLGKRVRIHSGSVIGSDGFGYVLDGGAHHKVPQLGTVIVDDDVEIGANVGIDRATIGATRIGAGTKIDNLVQIGHNCQIGKNCIICGHVGISGSVIIEDNAIMAGQAGLADHSKIGKGAVIGAKAGIMSNSEIGAGEFVMGAPAMPRREFMKREATLRKLPDTIRALDAKIKELQQQIADLQTSRNDD